MININIQTIHNVSDCAPLYLPHSLYLKPLAKMYISVALPSSKMGKSISNLDIMDKLSSALKPDKFLVLKVSKSTLDIIRFEAELDDRARLRAAISRLDGISLKVSGFTESFRVRAAESKEEFPTRHDWDSFFRDASHMDEMKAGERPDTIHLTHLPIRWFCPRHTEHENNVKPSESIFRRIFEKFGSVRCVDIPICDPYRSKMNSDINGMRSFSFEQDVLFEAYVQFDEYGGFVRAMDDFRGTKLVRKFVDKTQAVNIMVNFDKSKHLSDIQLQRRERVRKRLISKAKADEEELDRQKKLELENLERQRQKEEQLKLDELEKQREREEKRKEKHMKKIQERSQVEISQKIRIEERKLMIAQRKLESIRILEQLFDRIRLKHIKQNVSTRNHDVKEESRNYLRDRLVEKYKTATEKLLNEQRQKVQDIKNRTPILGLLRSKKSIKHFENDDADDEAKKRKRITAPTNAEAAGAASADGMSLNPFKAVAALAAAGGTAATPAYSSEAASEWMKSLSMFPYVPPVFAGMSGLYRPPAFGVPMNYRGFAPRIRSRGRGRGRGRGGYDPSLSSSSYYNYKNYNYEEDGNGGGGSYYRKSSYSRSRSGSRYRSKRRRSRSARSRSRSRSSRSRSKSKGRRRSRTPSSRSRTSSKSKNRRRSRTHSRARKSRTRSRSKTPPRTNKKLVSTRRSRSCDYSSSSSRSRSRSRSCSRSKSHRSRRSWSRHSHRRSPRHIMLETDKLVRSAEEIKRNVEKDTKELMREEEREIKENFRRRKMPLHASDIAGVPNNILSNTNLDDTVSATATASLVSNTARASGCGAIDREEDDRSERTKGRHNSFDSKSNVS